MNKNWYIYKSKNYSEIKTDYLKLQEIGKLIVNFEMPEINLWKVVDLILENLEKRDAENDWKIEKEYVGLFSKEIFNRLSANLLDLSKIPLNSSAKENKSNDELVKKLLAVGVKKDVAQNWLINLDVINKPEYSKNLETLVADIIEMSSQFVLIAEALGVNTGLASYNPEKLIEFFEGKLEDYSYFDLVKTCREVTFGEKEWRDLSFSAIDFLGFYIENNETEVKEYHLLIITVLLQVIYQRFERLSLEERKFVLQNYFYQAIILGIPVKEKLAETLKETQDLIWFARITRENILFLNDSKEKVAVFSGGNDKLLGELFVSYKVFKDGGGSVIDFINNNFGLISELDKKYTIWLEKTLEIYTQLNEGTLIDWFKDKEQNKTDKFRFDLTRLIFLYGLADSGYESIYNYYKNNQEILVPFKSLLFRIKELTDLTDQKFVEEFVNFVDKFKEHGLINPDDDFIVFNEEKSVFEWLVEE